MAMGSAGRPACVRRRLAAGNQAVLGEIVVTEAGSATQDGALRNFVREEPPRHLKHPTLKQQQTTQTQRCFTVIFLAFLIQAVNDVAR